MTTRTVIDCDKCGEKSVATPIHLSILNGLDKESGCPSLEISAHYDERDLCPGCAEKAFRMLLTSNSGVHARKELIKWLGIKERA